VHVSGGSLPSHPKPTGDEFSMVDEWRNFHILEKSGKGWIYLAVVEKMSRIP
jgi:hypothetical protein